MHEFILCQQTHIQRWGVRNYVRFRVIASLGSRKTLKLDMYGEGYCLWPKSIVCDVFDYILR